MPCQRSLHMLVISVMVAIAWAASVTASSAQDPKPATVAPPSAAAPPQAPSVGPTPQAGSASASDAWAVRDWVALGAAFSGPLGLLGALITVWFGQRNNLATIAAAQRNSEATITQKANEAELSTIGETLGTYYGPFLRSRRPMLSSIANFGRGSRIATSFS